MSNDKNINKRDNYIIESLSKNKRREYKPVPLLDGIEEIKQDIQNRLEQGDVTYGLEILDDNVETIRKGSMTVVVAPPNTGKSQVGLTIAVHLAKLGKQILICSCEMGAGLLMERQIKQLMGVSPKELKYAYENDRVMADKLLDNIYTQEAYQYLQNIFICETGGATVYDMIEMFDKFPNYDCIVIDYIQRIRGAGTDYDNVTLASAELQTYARRSGIPLIVCSQANRATTTNDNTKAEKRDFTKVQGKGSGSIEEDGDVILVLSEDSTADERTIYMTLKKNKYGFNKNITYKYKMNARLGYEYIGRG